MLSLVLSRRFPAFAIIAALALSACETPVTGDGAVTEHLRGVDFGVPARTAAEPDEPRPVASGTSVPTPPQSQLFFGRQSITGSGQGAVPSATGGVRLSFDGASLREVVDVILGEVLGVNYTIDPAVDGQVILSTTAPLAEADLLAVLETILQMHGATLVDLGGTYAVLAGAPVMGASQITPLGGDAPAPLIVGTGVTIVPLRYVSASAAAQFIQPLVSLPEQIRVDDSRNLVLFVGNAAERQNVVRTLGEIDVDWMAGRSVGIFPLRTATPEALLPELEGLFTPLDPFGAQSAGVRFLPMSRLNAVLAIASQPDQLVEVERWVQRLDRGSGSNVQFFVYQLQHTPAATMAELLNETFAENGGLGGSSETIVPSPAAFSPEAANGPESFDDDGMGLPATGFSSFERSNLMANVKIVPNEISNALVVRATPQAYDLIEQTIRRMDRAPLQVLIEATIAEVVLNDTLRYGVQYYFQSGSFRGGFNTTTPTSDGTIANNLLEPLAQLPGFNFIFTPGSSNITIDALSRVTDVQVLSSPSLVVQDNSEAVLTVGDEVPLVTRTAVSVDNPDAPVVNNIEYRETGVILEVRPRINSNNVVTLEVSQEVSRVQDVVTRADQNPIIAQRRISSKVNVTSGQTVVLGGLIQDSTTQGVDKVPVLGDVPVLGNLFRSTNNQTQRTELIVFITPRVIRNAEDARDISEELRSRLRSATPLPSPAGPPEGETAPVIPPASTPPAASTPAPTTVEPRPLVTSALEPPVVRRPPVARPAPPASTAVVAAPAPDSTPEAPMAPGEPPASALPAVVPPRQPAVPVAAPPDAVAMPIGFSLGAEPLPLARPIPGDYFVPAPRPIVVPLLL